MQCNAMMAMWRLRCSHSPQMHVCTRYKQLDYVVIIDSIVCVCLCCNGTVNSHVTQFNAFLAHLHEYPLHQDVFLLFLVRCFVSFFSNVVAVVVRIYIFFLSFSYYHLYTVSKVIRIFHITVQYRH